jgi:hypothetical protein
MPAIIVREHIVVNFWFSTNRSSKFDVVAAAWNHWLAMVQPLP